MRKPVLITGFPRSGTTLALRVLCPDLPTGMMAAGGLVNEPRNLTRVIDGGIREEVNSVLSEVVDNGFGMIKHPFLSLALGCVSQDYKVISVYRDVREVFCSVYRHHNRSSVLGNVNSWSKWAEFRDSMSMMERVIEPWVAAHRAVAEYGGEKEVWSYGDWGNWTVVNSDIRKTYPDPRESSGEVLMDVMAGKMFSDRRRGDKEWKLILGAGIVSSKENDMAQQAVNEVAEAYRINGISISSDW